MNNIIKGAYDLHIHTAPDVVKRKCDDIQLAERLEKSEMAGCIIKNHYADTSARASLLQKQFPSLKIGGGLVLNNSVGGLNPYAAEISVKMGAKIIWMPTMDALEYQRYKIKDKDKLNIKKYIKIIDEDNKLLSKVYEILEILSKNNVFLATGHISSKEGLILLREAKKYDVKTIVTHADNPANFYSVEEQKEAVNLGALIEYSYYTVFHKKTSIEEMAKQIKEVGYENIFLTTDFGQMDSLYPDEGIKEFIEKLMTFNFKENEIRKMILDIPEYIMNFR